MRICFASSLWKCILVWNMIFISGLFLGLQMSIFQQPSRTKYDRVEFETKCQVKVKDVAFLKVHKCGSTTVSNILQRFGVNNDLNLVLPDKPHEGHFWVLGNLSDFKWKSIIPIPAGQVFNILAVDTVYNLTAYRKIVPNNAFFLGILRDPVERFVSLEFYEGRGHKLQRAYGKNPYIFDKMKDDPFTKEISAIRGMSYDFGLPVEDRNNDDKINSFIEHIDKEFNFIMLMEYFDESLVLLKRQLCWNLKDILYIKRNQNTHKKNYALSPTNREILRHIQKADVEMYEHFKLKLFREMSAHGSDLLEEVHIFRNALSIVTDFCIFKKGDVLIVPPSSRNQEFRITIEECKLMLFNEFDLVNLFQKRQRDIYAASPRKKQ